MTHTNEYMNICIILIANVLLFVFMKCFKRDTIIADISPFL